MVCDEVEPELPGPKRRRGWPEGKAEGIMVDGEKNKWPATNLIIAGVFNSFNEMICVRVGQVLMELKSQILMWNNLKASF